MTEIELKKIENNDKKFLVSLIKEVDLDYFFRIMQEMNDCNHFNFKVIDKPIGKKQLYRDVETWVNQTTDGGITGDEYAGTSCILLPNGKYFKSDYTC